MVHIGLSVNRAAPTSAGLTIQGSLRYCRTASMQVMCRTLILPFLCLIALSCADSGSESASRPSPASPTARHVPVAQLPQIETPPLLAHTEVLASDRFEGRSPGSSGEELTVNYLV